jgi:hypothetical protein
MHTFFETGKEMTNEQIELVEKQKIIDQLQATVKELEKKIEHTGEDLGEKSRERENLKEKRADLNVKYKDELKLKNERHQNKWAAFRYICIFTIFITLILILSIIPQTGISSLFFTKDFYFLDYHVNPFGFIVIIILLVLVGNYSFWWNRLRMSMNILKSTQDEIDRLTPISKPEEAYFIDLTLINIKNLKAYYQMVKSQTEKSFYVSLFSGIIGFGLIAYGIFKPLDISTYAGVITEFIAGVFFYLYNKTVLQLKGYHDSLLDVQNILLAYKLVGSVKSSDTGDKNEMVKRMVDGLLIKQTTTSKSQKNDASTSNQET